MAIIRYNSLRPTSVPVITPLIHASTKSQRKHSSKTVMMCGSDHVSINLQIRSFHKNKVIFEDQFNGILCYKDENGEIISEGYDDENPRFQPQIPRFKTYDSRDVEIVVDLLQRCWLRVADKHALGTPEKGVAVQMDVNCNEPKNLI